MRALTVSCAVTIDAPVDEAVAWCRSTDARLLFPGVVSVATQGPSILTYEVDMKTRGAKESVLSVEEHLRETEVVETGQVVETAQRWSWPRGDYSTTWTTYRFTPEDGATRLDYEMRVVIPGSIAGERLNLALFGQAIEHAVQRFVGRLNEIPQRATSMAD